MKNIMIFGTMLILLLSFVSAIDRLEYSGSTTVAEGEEIVLTFPNIGDYIFYAVSDELPGIMIEEGVFTWRYPVPFDNDNVDRTMDLVVKYGNEINNLNEETITLTFTNTNRAPVADAGEDMIVNLGDEYFISALGSTDPDGDELEYIWTSLDGNLIILTPNSAELSGQAMVSGTLEIGLEVSDGTLTSEDTVTITVLPNQAPVADAGLDQTVGLDTVVTLSGLGSSDPEQEDLTYTWVQVSGPTVSLNGTGAQRTFVPTGEGVYVFNLTVSDGEFTSTDIVTITAEKQKYLSLKNLKVKVGGKTSSGLEDESDIGRDAEPGDAIEIDAELENLYEENIDIENVYMEVIIEEVDDGDDLDDETSESTIRDGRDKTFSLDFDLPLKIDEGDYTVVLNFYGEDEDGNIQDFSKELTLTVSKDRHNIRIMSTDLGSSTVSCNRRTSLNIDVLNLGEDVEEEIRITALSSELDLDYEAYDDGDIELDTGTADDAEYSTSVQIDAKDLPGGEYPIEVTVYRDEDRLEDTQTATLYVEECILDDGNDGTTVDDTSDMSEDDVDVVITPGTGSGSTGTTSSTSGTTGFAVISTPEDGFSTSPLYLGLLAVAIIVLLVLIVLIVMVIVKK